ncbi:MAG: tetratricopeptide repeat protein [Desulfobulbaceae bacterium]|nr:tetratricopeptide repeat protein [Desulfobulbaceae bacterium]
MRPPAIDRSLCGLSSLPILLVLGAVALLLIFPVQDFDIFWHLANGRAMLDSGHIVNQEIFSFTANGKHFSNHAWLAQIIFFLVFAKFGANGLIAVKVVIAMAIAVCLYSFGRRQGCSPLIASLICLLAFGASLFRYVERPELFSLLFLTLVGALLFLYRSKLVSAKILPLLPIIMVCWDVMHGALYGVIFVGAFMAVESLKALLPGKGGATFPAMGKRELQQLWLWVGLTVVLMLLSPYGLRSYDIFYEFMNNNRMTSMTAEFQPTAFNEQPLFWGMLAVTIVTVFSAGRSLDLTSLSLLILFTGLAVRYVRGIGPFALVAALLLAANLSPLVLAFSANSDRKRWVNGVCLTLLSFGLCYALYYKFSDPPRYDSLGLGISADAFPVGSARFVKSVNLTGNMYNTDRYGGYLAYYLFPERKIFHYNHHILFDALERYVHEPETRAQWQVNYAIIGRSDEWDMFSKDGFVPVYWEPTGAVMLKKTPENQALIQRYEIRYFSPVMPAKEFYALAKNPLVMPVLAKETSDYLAERHDQEKTEILVAMLSNQSILSPDATLALLARAEPYNADNPKLAARLGTLSYQQGLFEQAETYLKRAVTLDPAQIEARFSLAYLCYDQQNFTEAAEHFKKILRLNPRHPDTIYGLGLCFYQLGSKPEAKQFFQQYLELVPDGPWAEQARKFIAQFPVGS